MSDSREDHIELPVYRDRILPEPRHAWYAVPRLHAGPRLHRATACALLAILAGVAVPRAAWSAPRQDTTRVRRVIRDSAIRRRAITRPVDTLVRFESLSRLQPRLAVVRRMPSVVGLDSLTAVRRLAAAGLTRYRIVVPSGDSIAVDAIAKQSRRPDDSVAVTEVIFLTLSGQPIVRVPSVVGHRLDTASMIVRRYGLQPVRQVSPTAGPPEIVVRQYPEPRTPVRPQAAVTLWVPRQAPTQPDTTLITVPELVRRTRPRAEALLLKVGLRAPPIVRWEPGEGEQLDTVIDQSHAPGSRVPPNTRLTLTLQRAQARRMPNLIGLDTATAARRLASIDIVRRVVHRPGGDSIAENRIVRQAPLENTVIQRLTVPEVWLAARPPVRVLRVPSVIGLDTLTALRRFAAVGLARHRIIVPSGDSIAVDTVARQSPRPGDSVVVTETVVLTLRGQSTLVVVPNVVHRTRRMAVAQLGSAGLREPPLVRWEPGQGEQLDTVIAQSHAPGSRVRPNTQLTLMLQRAQARRMPNLIGLDTTAADRRLASVDIGRRRLHRPGGDSIAENRIARQLPLGNAVVQPGTVPELWLAGRRRVDTLIVPPVVGLDSSGAARALAAAGFNTYEVQRPAVGTAIDAVASQRPQSGEKFLQAVTVVLTLGSATPIAVPPVTGLRVDSARRVLQTAGLSAGVGGWTPAALRARETVRSQQPDSGQLVAVGETVTLVPDERPALIIVIGLFLGGGLALTRVAVPPPKITAAIDVQPGVVLQPSLEESHVHIALGLRGQLIQLPVLHEPATGSTHD